MSLTDALAALPEIVPEQLDKFRRHIDPAWVEEALVATGTATVRRRRLPADHVLWLVIGMALMRNESIDRVVEWLDLALPAGRDEPVARSAIAKARQRLGEDALAYLFVLTAATWATRSASRHRWRGLSVWGQDGTTLRVPDSSENWKAFGGQVGNGERNGSAYPTVRLLGLMAVRSHILGALVFDAYGTGETSLAQDLWRELPDDSLVLMDRAFLVAHQLSALVRSGQNRHWLTRAKTQTRLRRIKRLGRDDELVEIELSDQTRRAHPEIPEVWTVRAIRYQVKGFRPSTLLTSLLDAAAYPADELVALYHERWELEIGYDEVKTHLLAREETIRSRTPDGVRQEIWGIALAYNLVRVEMERVADELQVEPTRISFVNALALVRYTMLISSTRPIAPGKIPSRIADMRRQLKLLLLPERRRGRSFPRAVKLKMSNYLRKPPSGGRAK
jgi:Insertion element 4 transposase N-terminal/Transposase DDE domain